MNENDALLTLCIGAYTTILLVSVSAITANKTVFFIGIGVLIATCTTVTSLSAKTTKKKNKIN